MAMENKNCHKMSKILSEELNNFITKNLDSEVEFISVNIKGRESSYLKGAAISKPINKKIKKYILKYALNSIKNQDSLSSIRKVSLTVNTSYRTTFYYEFIVASKEEAMKLLKKAIQA